MLATLDLVISGALLQAGMGHLTYDELPGALTAAVELVVDWGHAMSRGTPR